MHGLRRILRCNGRFSLRSHQHLQWQCKAHSISRYAFGVRAATARLENWKEVGRRPESPRSGHLARRAARADHGALALAGRRCQNYRVTRKAYHAGMDPQQIMPSSH
jgi:hypothetical protein